MHYAIMADMKNYTLWALISTIILSANVALAAPVISLIAPKSDTVWETSGRYFVAWTSTEISPSEQTALMLKRADGVIIPLATNTVNDGTQIVSLPLAATAGDYQLVVSAASASSEVAVKIVTASPKTKEDLQLASALTAIQDLLDRFSAYWRR